VTPAVDVNPDADPDDGILSNPMRPPIYSITIAYRNPIKDVVVPPTSEFPEEMHIPF
jgi:hypothetical protein